MSDECEVIKAGVISKAMTGRYMNTRRLLRDLENIEEHFAKEAGNEALQAQILQNIKGNSDSNDKMFKLFADKFEAMEAKIAEAKLASK